MTHPRPDTADRAAAQDSAELARLAFDALGRRDLDAFLELMDPAVEFTSLVQESEATVYRGHSGVRQFLKLIVSVFPDWRPTVESVESFGDTVVVRARMHGTGAGSGMSIEQTMWQVAWSREGKVAGWRWFRTEAEALEAVQAAQ